MRLFSLILLLCLPTGCTTPSRGPISLDHEHDGEHRLLQAIREDPQNGAAHNELGLLLMERGECYRAAQHFRRAMDAMPWHPEPRRNFLNALEAPADADSQ